MTPELPPNPRGELEARMTAYLLGELPAHEAAALRQAIDEDADLAELCDRLRPAIKLVREVAANPASQPATQPAPLKLSDERRQALLAHFNTIKPVQFEMAKTPSQRETSWLSLLAIAAVFMAILIPLFLPALAKSKAKAVRINVQSNLKQVELAKQMWADDNKKTAADAPPTFQELTPYLGGVHSVNGENYVPGKVGEPATAELAADKAKEVFGGKPAVNAINGRSDLVALSADGRLVFVNKDAVEERLKERLPGEQTQLGYSLATAPANSYTRPLPGDNTETLGRRSAGGFPPPASVPPTPATPRTTIVLPSNGEVAFKFDAETKSLGITPDDKTLESVSGLVNNPGQIAAPAPPTPAPIATAGTPLLGDLPQVGRLFQNDRSGGDQADATGQAKEDAAHAIQPAGSNVTLNYFDNGAAQWANDDASRKHAPAAPGDIPLKYANTVDLQQELRQLSENSGSANPLLNRSQTLEAQDNPSSRTGNFGDRPNSLIASAGIQNPQDSTSANPFSGSGARFSRSGGVSATRGLATKSITPIGGTRAPASGGAQVPASPEQDQPLESASVVVAQDAEPNAATPAPGAETETAPVKKNLFDQASLPSAPNNNEPDTNVYHLNIVGYINIPTDAVRIPVKTPDTNEVAALSKSATAASSPAPVAPSAPPADDLPLQKPATPAPEPQPEVLTTDNAFSTFSLNVSDVSFKLAAASLEKGVMPDPASIRSEEFINAFDYRDPAPAPGAPLAFAWERARYPFAHNRDLLRFSVQTAAAGREAGRPLNLVLLLDNSGSMERADRVAIIHEALRVLASQLQPQDTLSVVTFARTARLWVDGVSGSQAGEVAEKVSGLTPEGGTNLEEAMRLAYETARRHYLAGGINRVVLLTDGAANLGNVDPAALKLSVEANRKQGIMLDCFGIGWEGYNDDLLEVLTRNGDGRYGFLNTPEEAATGFAAQLAGALHVAAEDVKVQVEFNPRRVTAYRQIGYAKLQLKKEEFRDNSVAAAAIGAAESGNALYTIEVNPAGEGPLCTVHVRYKVPGTTDYQEHAWDVPYTGGAAALEQSSPAMRLAAGASAFSEWLAASPYAAEVTPDELLTIVRGVPEIYGADARPKKLEWMIRTAKSLK